MAAITVTAIQIDSSGTNITIKLNDEFSVPDALLVDNVQSFRVWVRDLDYLVVFTNDEEQEISVSIPIGNVDWVSSEMPFGLTGDRFRIDYPCTITRET